tara:strand:- start:667 stop:1239 length:573 start_codon:yes stop_codon:yes gene_type:complete
MDNLFSETGDTDSMYGSYNPEEYNQPNIYEMMGEYILQGDMPAGEFTKGRAGGMGVTAESYETLQTMKALIPEYGETSNPFFEAYDKQSMLSKVYDAEASLSKNIRQAKMKASSSEASYGKMGFRSGESGQASQYLNNSVRNAANSASASAQKARLGYQAKITERRKGFVDSLWELYGDFLAMSPERVEK